MLWNITREIQPPPFDELPRPRPADAQFLNTTFGRGIPVGAFQFLNTTFGRGIRGIRAFIRAFIRGFISRNFHDPITPSSYRSPYTGETNAKQDG